MISDRCMVYILFVLETESDEKCRGVWYVV